MKKSTKTFLKYMVEFIIVAFGVFLGVFVSEWNSQKKVDANTEKTLSYIIDEIETNIKFLENTIDYQTMLTSKVDSLVDGLNQEDFELIYYTNKKFRFNELPSWQGLKFIPLETIVYESAKISGVLQEFNISTTKLIARIYNNQLGYSKFSEILNNRLSDINSTTKIIDVLAIFEQLKYDGLATEKWLLSEFKEARNKLIEIRQNKTYKQ